MPDVTVLGAGLAGLACARHLTRAGLSVEVHEAASAVGGRVRTDVVDGMLLDHGFQVLNTAYPELARVADLDALDLRPFTSGALVRYGDRLHRVGSWRSPDWAVRGATAPVGGLLSKAAVARLGAEDALLPVHRLLARPETSTREHLRAHGVSDATVDRFLRPFLSGVFLEPDLATSSRFFDLVWRSFARGVQAVPATGMGALPAQLAQGLDVHLGSRVTELPEGPVVVATDPLTAASLTGLEAPAMNGVTTHYHLADEPPTGSRAIVLDGEGSGPVTSTVVLTNVAPSYAPGRVLVSSSVLDDSGGERAVRDHLARVYGADTSRWEHVAAYAVPQALPSMAPPLLVRQPVSVRPDVWVAGDWRDTASIQGALVSGRRAAEAVLKA